MTCTRRQCLSRIGALCLVPAGVGAATAELLEPGKAFRVSARLVPDSHVEVRFRVAEGYYLYRDKLRFSLDPAIAQAGLPQLPDGLVKDDEFFGKVETYRGEVTVSIPARLPPGADRLTLRVVSQGCADAGICYTPQDQRLVLNSRGDEATPAPPRSLLESLEGR